MIFSFLVLPDDQRAQRLLLRTPLPALRPIRPMRARIALLGRDRMRIARLRRFDLHLSPLDANDLAQRVHDLDQIRLMRHHLVDVLVRGRNLVDHAAVLATFDA